MSAKREQILGAWKAECGRNNSTGYGYRDESESPDEQLQRREAAEWDLVRAARDLMDFGGPLSSWQTFLLESLTREWGRQQQASETDNAEPF